MFTFLARIAVARPRLIAGLGLLFLIVAAIVGGTAVGKLRAPNAFIAPDSPSARAQAAIERVTGAEDFPGIFVLVDSAPTGAFEKKVAADLKAVKGVAKVYAPGITSKDGKQVVLAVSLKKDAPSSYMVKKISEKVPKGVLLGGSDTANRQVDSQAERDLGVAELIAFPLLALISLLIFRGVAALLPLAVGAISVVGASLVLGIVNAFMPLSSFALNLVVGVGLGLAVDYSLLLVWRFREELAAGGSLEDALARTLNSAGRAVTFSALTVAAALITLTIFPQGFLISMGIGGAAVALVSGVAALLVLPSLLVLLSDRIGRVEPEPAATGRWYRFTHRVMRRPYLVGAVTSVALLFVASPSLSVIWSGVDASVLPGGQSSRIVQQEMFANFPSQDQNPMAIAIYTERSQAKAVAAYAKAVGDVPGVDVDVNPTYLGSDVWELVASSAGDPIYVAAQRTLAQIEAIKAPFEIGVDGPTAQFQDQKAAITANVIPALVVLCVLTVGLLWLMTGSVILPLKALAMNALSAATATGVLVFIFQHGRLSGLLDYSSQGGIEQGDFLILIAVGFALSTDYGVLLMARIKEARDNGHDNRESIALGLERTGRVVTAAAILMAVAIGAFATSHVVFLKEIGVGAVVEVLVDAFIVRSVLMPALMVVLGDWNWWSPRFLARLHARIGIQESGPAVRLPMGAGELAHTPAPAHEPPLI